MQIYGFSAKINDRSGLYQVDAGFAAAALHLFGPDAALDFPDVGLAQQIHAKAALADAAADGAGKLAGEQAPVEGEFFFPLFALDRKLAAERSPTVRRTTAAPPTMTTGAAPTKRVSKA